MKNVKIDERHHNVKNVLHFVLAISLIHPTPPYPSRFVAKLPNSNKMAKIGRDIQMTINYNITAANYFD